MSPFTFTLRGLLFLNLLSVSTLTFSACTDLPNYDPNTGKITIPCLKVPVTQPFVGTQIQTFSINLNQRSGGAYVFASAANITEYKSAKNAELKHFEAIYKKALINELKAFEVNFDTYKNELQVK